MRNVTFAMNISVDGCYEHTLFTPDEEVMEYFTCFLQDVDMIVYGRKTYELMEPYWPDVAKNQSGTKEENEFAKTLTAIDKVIVSTTLEDNGSLKIVRSNPENEIHKLKQQPGKKISLSSTSMLQPLMKLGLIDEFQLVIHPAIIGKGKKLLENIGLPGRLHLKLADSKVFRSGVIGLHYLKQ